jgi:LL-diaminopimelate aminotransferase
MSVGVERKATARPTFFAILNQKITAMQEQGLEVIRLDIGSPDLPPPFPIIEALQRAAALPDRHSYQNHLGTRVLREAWAQMYQRLCGVCLDPLHEIVPLLGSKEGIFHLALALLEPGDVVLVPDPGYPTYTQGARIAGGQLYGMPLRPEYGFLPDLDVIPPTVANRARLMWLNYPNNPTGANATWAFFERAVAFARRFNILLCHDAAYMQVTYHGYRAPSILEVTGAKEVAVEFNSLSKSHNMAGWRVGVAVGNARALGMLYALKTELDSSHFLPILEAATLALTGDQTWLLERNEAYRKRRDTVVEALRKLGLTVQSPKGSMYVWSPVPIGYSSLVFTETLLEQTGVSLAPGSIFGEHGEGYTRISLVAPVQRVAEAMSRLHTWWEDAGASCA